MKRSDVELCGHCMFWSPDPESTRDYGDCRKNAPEFLARVYHRENIPREDACLAVWPLTRVDYWCGDWRGDP